MKSLLVISFKSLLNRRLASLLTILSIALSVCLLLGIERVRTSTKKSFESTISGVDLIVGSRTAPVNLLLYSVFRIGNATNNISYSVFEELSRHPLVEWTIPISLGDSHRGYKVVGTNLNYFKHYKYSGGNSLEFKAGEAFENLFDVVLGSEVAKALGYELGERLTLSHGTAEVSFQDHADKPFEVVGILAPTGTPVDRSVHISLEAVHALHVDWQTGATSAEAAGKEILSEVRPGAVTAFFMRLKSRIAVFNVQREVNEYPDEALMAILPGVSLRDLWVTIGSFEKTLLLVSSMVLVISLLGMVIALLSTLNERRREMAILRSVGAKKRFVFGLLLFEAGLLSFLGMVTGIALLYILLFLFRPILETVMGLSFGLFTPSLTEGVYMAIIFSGALIAGVIPAAMAYNKSLSDGLTVKI